MSGTPTAITIGAFDGAHLGHRGLVAAGRRAVGGSGRVIVLSFDPHPRAFLNPKSAPPQLTSFGERSRILKGYGADEVLKLVPDKALLALSANDFISHVVRDFSPAYFIEGPDFRFGKAREAGINELRAMGRDADFGVEILEEVTAELSDQSIVRASSSVARWLLAQGRVTDASRVLGRPYRLTGPVKRGDRRGRTIGFPTVNIDAPTMRPADGVYAARAVLPDGRTLPAAVNIGTRPTVEGVEHRVEAHLLSLPTSLNGAAWSTIEGIDEYNWTCSLDMLGWVRDQVRFDSIDHLAAQLTRDCERVLDIVELAEHEPVASLPQKPGAATPATPSPR